MRPAAALPVALPARGSTPIVVAFLACYLVLDWISYIDPYGPLGITPWNPPPGLSIFMILRYGPGMAVWMGAAALAGELLIRDVPAPWPVVVIACAWFAAGYAVTVFILRRRLRFDPALATLRDATLFTVTVLVSALVIGMGFIGIFVAAGVVPLDDFPRTFGQFWIGDVIGIVVTTPFLLALARPRPAGPRPGLVESGLQLVAIGVALFIVFGLGIGAELQLFYVLFLPLIWIAMRRGIAGTTIATVLVQVGLIAALKFGGHVAGEVLDFQFLMLALALTGLFLGAAVEERHAIEQKLRDKQLELDRSLRAAATSELASALAHEVNQPLSAIASYTRACQILYERGDPAHELPSVLSKVVSEASRAGMVVHRLREFVRMGTIRQERLSVPTLLANASEAAGLRAAPNRVMISIETAPRLPEVLGDRVQLETVMHNLIANAVDALKETPGERRVTLAASRHGDGFVRLVVSDNGPGIAAAARATLFEPFTTQKAEGLGLGLAISRTIVEAHGGALWLDDKATGAAFCLTLPAAR